jgi:hypothetical protein
LRQKQTCARRGENKLAPDGAENKLAPDGAKYRMVPDIGDFTEKYGENTL